MSSEEKDEKEQVEVRVLHANGLKVADTYTSDPYVVLSVDSKKVGKTKKKKKTLDPIWDESFTVKWKKTEELTLNVYDADLLRDDFLGVVTVRYSDARISAGRQRTYKLFPRSKKDKNISGSISLLFSFDSYLDDPVLHRIEQGISEQKTHPCKLRVLSAKNLKESEIMGGKVDSYAVIKCGRTQKRTHIADNAQDPVWDYETEIEWHKGTQLVIEIRDFDFLSSYDFLGFFRISQEKARGMGGKRGEVELEGRSENDEGITGSVVVQFLFEGMKEDPLKAPATGGSIFGMSLEDISNQTNELIPKIVVDTIRFLVHSGLDRCGIFRLCGDLAEVQRLKKKYLSPHTSLNLKEELGGGEERRGEGGEGGGEGYSPDSVASLLKRFFFELPNPLIDFVSFEKMLDAHGEWVVDDDQDKFNSKLIEIITKMEKNHLYPLIMMSHFLNLVSSFSEKNLMPLTNLAVCFGPTFSRTEQLRPMVMVEQLDRKMVENLLELYPRWREALSQEDKTYMQTFIEEMDG